MFDNVGLGLNCSDVNVGLIRSESNATSTPGLMIISVLRWLQTTAPIFGNIKDDLNCRVPVVRFQHLASGISLSMVVESENAYKTSLLLKQYNEMDPRFAILTVVFRTFAKICLLDQPELGSLPPHAFTIMVLYYLQQEKVLPVLHQLVENGDNPDNYLSKSRMMHVKY